MPKTYLEYIFQCTPLETNQYLCQLTLRKIPIDKAGLQHTQEEFVLIHHIILMRYNNYKWVWYCEKLNQSTILEPPISLACLFSPRSKRWRIVSNYKQINSLFTLNMFGEGLGLFAMSLCDQNVLELSSDQPELELYSLGYGKKWAFSRIYDGAVDENKNNEEDPEQDTLTKWQRAIN